jgi:hypothetical protein
MNVTLHRLSLNLLQGCVGLTGAIALIANLGSSASAQAAPLASADVSQPSQSSLLSTEPITVQVVPVSVQSSVYNPAKLKTVSATLQANPSGNTDNFTDWIYATPQNSSDTDPIGFFKVPPRTTSVGVNIKN